MISNIVYNLKEYFKKITGEELGGTVQDELQTNSRSTWFHMYTHKIYRMKITNGFVEYRGYC